MLAESQKVAFDRPTRDAENAADVAGAFPFLDPGEALKLSFGDADWRE